MKKGAPTQRRRKNARDRSGSHPCRHVQASAPAVHACDTRATTEASCRYPQVGAPAVQARRTSGGHTSSYRGTTYVLLHCEGERITFFDEGHDRMGELRPGVLVDVVSEASKHGGLSYTHIRVADGRKGHILTVHLEQQYAVCLE